MVGNIFAGTMMDLTGQLKAFANNVFNPDGGTRQLVSEQLTRVIVTALVRTVF